MRNYPWIRDGLAALVWTVVLVLLSVWGALNPPVMLVVILAAPVLTAMAGGQAGLCVLIGGMLMPCGALISLGAPWQLILSFAGYSALVGAASLYSFGQPQAFLKALGCHMAAIMAGLCLMIMGLRTVTGHNLFTGGAALMCDYIAAQEDCDQILYQCIQWGLAGALELTQQAASLLTSLLYGRISFLPEVRQELLNSLRTTFEYLLYLYVPEILVYLIIGGGLLGLCWPICCHRRRGMDTIAMPRLDLWHLPRDKGLWTLVLLLGYMCRYFYSSYAELFFGIMLINVFNWIYMVQGAAFMEFHQKKRGASVGSRRMIIGLLGVLLPFALVLLGLMDQLNDTRGLRAAPEDEEEK